MKKRDLAKYLKQLDSQTIERDECVDLSYKDLVQLERYRAEQTRLNHLKMENGDVEGLWDIAIDYFAECDSLKKVKQVTGISARLGVTEATLSSWLSEKSNENAYREFAEYVYSQCERETFEALARGGKDAVPQMFVAKALHGHSENKTTTIQIVDGITPKLSRSAIAEKYNANLIETTGVEQD